ncbi:MAG: outer membrane protein assembly factor BamD [Burkholderiaceae bacterium]
MPSASNASAVAAGGRVRVARLLKAILGRSGRTVIASCAIAMVLGGCGLLSGDSSDKTANWTAQRLYSEAEDEMSAGGYTAAIKYFESLQSRFPFGRYAQQAQMEIAYAQYKDGEKDLSLAAADRFIKQYPNSPNVDYLWYLKGLVNFNDNLGLLGSLAQQDLTERDPKALRDAFDAFRELITRYPDSKYSPDAVIRLKYLVNAMAAHEVHVARYYLRRGAYVAAANRAEIVVRQYQQAPAVRDALQIMVAAYDGLALPQLRDDAKRVLDANFPASTLAVKEKNPWWKLW